MEPVKNTYRFEIPGGFCEIQGTHLNKDGYSTEVRDGMELVAVVSGTIFKIKQPCK